MTLKEFREKGYMKYLSPELQTFFNTTIVENLKNYYYTSGPMYSDRKRVFFDDTIEILRCMYMVYKDIDDFLIFEDDVMRKHSRQYLGREYDKLLEYGFLLKKFEASIILPDLEDLSLYNDLTIMDIIEAGLFRLKEKLIYKKADDYAKAVEDDKKLQEERRARTKDEVYKNLSVEDQEFLEKAARIRSFLLYAKSQKEKVSHYTPEELVSLSILLAILWVDYPQNSVYSYLQEQLRENISLNLDLDRDKFNRNSYVMDDIIYPIRTYYTKYYKGNSFDYPVNSIGLEMFKNVFNIDINTNNLVSRLLNDFNMDTNQVEGIEHKVIETYNNGFGDKAVLDFNQLNTNTKDFILLVQKIYNDLERQNKTLQRKLSDDELYDMALLIAAYYQNSNLQEYFASKGYSINKILEPIGIKTNPEDIEQINIDSESFQKFTTEKVLPKLKFYRRIGSLKTDDIIKANTTLEKLHSGITGEILRPLNTSDEINVFDEANKYKDRIEQERQEQQRLQQEAEEKEIERLENLRKEKLTKEIFEGCSHEVYKFMQAVAEIHKQLNEVQDIDIKRIISILLATSKLSESAKDEDSDEVSFLIHLELYPRRSQLLTNYDMNTHYDMDRIVRTGNDIDIDIINKYYKDYIFRGYNDGKSKSDISVINIIQNIFNQDIHKIYSKVVTFLNNAFQVNISNVNPIQEFDKMKEQKRKRKEEKLKEETLNKRQSELLSIVGGTNECVQRILPKINHIYQHIKSIESINSEQRLQLAVIISVLSYKNGEVIKKVLNRNGITIEYLQKHFNIDNEIVKKVYGNLYSFNKEINELVMDDQLYQMIQRYVAPLKGYDEEKLLTEMIQEVVKSDGNILELLNVDNKYHRVKREIETGKRYEDTLTTREKSELIQQLEIESPDVYSLQSIVNYGSELLNSSVAMQGEILQTLTNSKTSETLERINEIIATISPDKGDKKSTRWLKIGRKKSKEEVQLSQSDIENLSKEIETLLNSLNKELEAFESLRTLTEAYYQKSAGYTRVLESSKEELKHELLTNTNHLVTSNLNVNLQSINNKINQLNYMRSSNEQYMLQIDLLRSNYSRIMSTLVLAKNSILPLVNNGYVISNGSANSQIATTTIQGVLELLSALTTDSIKGARKSFHLLSPHKHSTMDQQAVTTPRRKK